MSRLVRQTTLLFLTATVLFVAGGCKKKSPAAGKKVLVLGCDGMDPRLVRRLIDEGRMPNFARLERQGDFKALTTSIPPQSPVAWSNFITGADPGVHGIFDFIHRDPAPTKPTLAIEPYFSTSIDSPGEEPWFTVPVGRYDIPSSVVNPFAEGAATELARRGTPFWDYLDEQGIPVRMYRLPANYPPSESGHGHVCCLSGMGVPDALKNQGTSQHFSTRPRQTSTSASGMELRLRQDKSGAFIGKLIGPENEFLAPPAGATRPPNTEIELAVYPDRDNNVAKIRYVNQAPIGIPNEQVDLLLNVGQWSEWKEVYFLKTPIGPSFGTMVRFYLQSVEPYLDLYVSPLNFIPTAPEAPISEPLDFVEDIGGEIGPFSTQGFAEEFNALKNNIFTDEEYRVQAWQVLDEWLRLLDYALDHYEDGLLFFYFSSTDLQAHMFWWDSDETHPTRTPDDARKYHRVVEDVYVKMDEALGKCMAKLGEDATILVMSDHGFCNFRRGFGLNAWLRDQGYLAASHGVLIDADWSRTRAYGMGLNGLYLNLQGREKNGIVSPAERDALLDEITERLLAFRDPENGRQVIKRVYRTDECYTSPDPRIVPDLIIGYDRDYRASWKTCLGDCDKEVMIDNTDAWSADHCIAHDVVPGVIFANRKITLDEPSLIDVAPTVLAEFGVAQPASMKGRSLFGRPDVRMADR